MRAQFTCSNPAESGMSEVTIIEESGQSGDAQVRIKLNGGRIIEVATDPEFRAVHVYTPAGDLVGWVTFEQLYAIAAKNAV